MGGYRIGEATHPFEGRVVRISAYSKLSIGPRFKLETWHTKFFTVRNIQTQTTSTITVKALSKALDEGIAHWVEM